VSRLDLECLSTTEKDAVHQSVLHVLESVGVGINSDAVLDMLAGTGARVDAKRRIVKLPPQLVEECLAKAPEHVRLASRDAAHDLVVGPGLPLACTTDGEASMVLDDATGEVREASRDDLVAFYRLSDAAPELDFIWTSLMACDLDPLTAGLENDLVALESTSKHVQSVVAHSPEEIPPLLEMLEIIAGAKLHDRPIYSSLHCPVSPLQFEGDKLDASISLARAGVPILIHPLPLMGTTAPMSVPATAVVTIAEFVAGVVIFQVAAPGCPLMVAATGGAADLRTGGFLCGAPEVALLNAICLSMSRHYGLPSVSCGISTDAKAVNFQAGVEGTMTAMSAVLSGADILVSAGLIDGAQISSAAKLVLDCDSIGALRRLLKMPTADDASMLIDDIIEVGPAGHFLNRRSSRDASRRGEIWRPAVFQRGNRSSFVDRPLLDDALERAGNLLAAHTPTPIPDDVRREARAVLDRYARIGDTTIH
jgi:trimethylamine---corrinoid protein Co-methyltransferase